MKTKHTPGPWEFNKAGIEKFKHGFIAPMIRTSVGMNHICSIHQVNDCWLHPDKADEAIANAKLIAAAPAMVAFLIKLEKAIRTEPFDDDLYKELTELIKATTE